jgi:hypothetical protein
MILLEPDQHILTQFINKLDQLHHLAIACGSDSIILNRVALYLSGIEKMPPDLASFKSRSTIPSKSAISCRLEA